MRSLFVDRVLVGIADTARVPLSGILDPSADRSVCTLSNYTDVPETSISELRKAFYSGNRVERAGHLLNAFWEDNIHLLKIIPAQARLYINPPEGVQDEDTSFKRTLRTQRIIKGTQGDVSPTLDMSSIELAAIDGTHIGFFDDVCIFWDQGAQAEDIELLNTMVLPGTTMTFIYPGAKHQFWTQWADMNFGWETYLKGVSRVFDVTKISDVEENDIYTVILGVEKKASS